MQDKLSTFYPTTLSMQELDLAVLEKGPKERQVQRYLSELYKFGIVTIFHVDVKVTRQYDWHILTTSPCPYADVHYQPTAG
jgi:hypothetical protein